MPKIIENVREQLLNEAKRQIAGNGYAKTTIRSVAKACGLGIGTVYNYFSSKEMLVASFLAEDWKQSLQRIERDSFGEAEAILKIIYCCLSDFMQRYSALFCDSNATRVYAITSSIRHKQLREQLAEYVKPICANVSVKDKDFLAEWIAESLVTWTVAGKNFEEQYEIIKQFIK